MFYKPLSACCQAPVIFPQDVDCPICSACNKHCSYYKRTLIDLLSDKDVIKECAEKSNKMQREMMGLKNK